MFINNRLINLDRNGRLLVFTDLHGNWDDYIKYLSKWDSNDPDCHIVIAGDFIHSIYLEDCSVEILDDIIDKYDKYENFHVLLGNHEWAHITNANIFKGNTNQKRDFEKLILNKKGSLEPSLSKYIDFFKSIPFFLQTDNGIFVSHAGPSTKINLYEDFVTMMYNDNYLNEYIFSMLWSRFKEDYDVNDVSKFLNIVKSNVMIVGHNVVNGHEDFGRQLILSSSFGCENKEYLDIDLTSDVFTVNDLKKFLKKL